MIFSSTEFFVFLGLVLALVALARTENQRRNVLLVASYLFYGWWNWRFCFLLFLTTVVDYAVGLKMEAEPDRGRRRTWLLLSIAQNLGVLFYFKYTNFFLDSLKPALAAAGIHVPHLDIVLPVGISFFTFQSMSYTIDVYWQRMPATRSFRDFMLFVAFFPPLLSGPIVRASLLLPQLRDHEHRLSGDNLRRGGELFLRGFVKKVLFADTLAVAVDPVFHHPSAFGSLSTWIAVLAYAGQIYYDFSGYTDMARGCGRMFGFEFPINFKHPYLSRSLTEFWRRWHISLSTWLRDYLYIPLGGNRLGRGRTYLNLAATMLLGGLWHGASWTFVVWGAMHGAGLVFDKLRLELGARRGPGAGLAPGEGARREAEAEPIRARNDDAPHGFAGLLAWAGTFLYVLVAWVFFRAQNFADAATVLRKMAGLEPGGAHWVYVPAVVALAVGALAHVVVKLRDEHELLLDLRRPMAWTAAAIALILVLLFSPFNSNPFIYFQF